VIIYATFFANHNDSIKKNTAITVEKVSLEQFKIDDPEQFPYWGKDFIHIRDQETDLKLYPQASYRIYAMVMGKTKYSWGWESKIAPYDLALAWNKLMLPENQKGIIYSQGNRWYYYSYNEKFPLESSYISKHSSNHHIIPANSTLRKALDEVKTKDIIYMEGYLVYIKGKVKNGTVWWNSSLTRNDTGEGACEVFYIKKAVLGDKVYK